MVQVSVLFCLEIGAETETFQEQVETKLLFRALSIAPPSSVVRAGPKEEGEEEEGVGGGAPDRIRVCLSNSHLLAF